MSSDRLDARSLKNPVLRSLQIGAFCLHAILAASFVSIPVALSASGELAAGDHYRVYLPVLLISLICIAPVLMRSHRAGAGDGFYRVAIGFVIAGELLLWWVPAHTLWLGAALTSFFIGFNYLEAALPSLVSRAAPDHGRGGALGTYATAQFLGLFSGGLVGGAVAGAAGYDQVFLVAALVATAWLGYAARVRH